MISLIRRLNLLKGKGDYIKRFSSRSSGLIKIHKPHNPARPTISSVGSTTHKLSTCLTSLLCPLVGTISNSNVDNNVVLHKLYCLHVNGNFKLVSLDVKSQFTIVIVDDLLDYLNETMDNVPELE